MIKKTYPVFATTMLFASVLACGYSPILHHVNAEDLKESVQNSSNRDRSTSTNDGVGTGDSTNGSTSNSSSNDQKEGNSDSTNTANTVLDPNATNPVASESASPSPVPSPSPSPATCEFELEKSGICLSLTWDTKPTDEEEGAFTLHFWDKSNSTDAGPYTNPPNTLKVVLWMPDMGHGSSPVKTKQAVDENGNNIDGVYNVTHVTFVMPGDWEIRIQLKKDGKVVDEAILPYTY